MIKKLLVATLIFFLSFVALFFSSNIKNEKIKAQGCISISCDEGCNASCCSCPVGCRSNGNTVGRGQFCRSGCTPNWGPCSKSCGGGVQSDGCGNTRACNTQSCPTPPPVQTTCYRCNSGGWCEAFQAVPPCTTNCNSCPGNTPPPPPPTCSPTDPSIPNLLSPQNNSTLTSPTTVNLNWDNLGWGTGCPQNNLHTVFMGSSISGPWIQRASTTGTSLNISGLQAGTKYFWFVQKSNGSRTVNSQIFNFTTRDYPSYSYGGQILTDVCGNGFSGKAGAGLSGISVTNPVRFRININSTIGDKVVQGYFVMIPRNLSVGASKIDVNTALSLAINSKSIYAQLNMNQSNIVGTISQSISSYNGSGWTTTLNGADHQNNIGDSLTTTILSIGGVPQGTFGEILSSTNTQFNFLVRFENGFGSTLGNTNPTGVWDIYTLGVMSDSNNNLYNEPQFTKVGEWGVDLIQPSSILTGPVFQNDGSFNITYGATDIGAGVNFVNNSIVRSNNSLQLRDNTIGQNLGFNSTFLVQNDMDLGSVNNSNYLINPTRNYQTSYIPESGFTYFYDVIDRGCNSVRSTTNVLLPSPWVMTTGGNVSINGAVNISGGNSSISVPELSNFSIQGLPGLNEQLISGAPFFSKYSSMSASGIPLAKPSQNNSEKSRSVLNYFNESVNPITSVTSWYDYFLNILNTNTTLITIDNTNGQEIQTGSSDIPNAKRISGNLSSIYSKPANSQFNINVIGNLFLSNINAPANEQWSLNCDTKSIILVSGDLLIAPNIRVSNNLENRCLFIVKGKIVIETGKDQTPYIQRTSSNQPYYKIIEAGLISDSTIEFKKDNRAGDQNKWPGIYVRGLIASMGDLRMFRDLNTFANANHPSLIINFDPSLIQVFSRDLKTSYYSIREP